MAGGRSEQPDKFQQLYEDQELKALRRERITQKLREKKLRQEKTKAKRKEFKNRLEPIPAVVGQVNVEGLIRTQDPILTGPIKTLFTASNYGDVIKNLRRVLDELKATGCFKSVNVLIDKNEENDKILDVTIQVVEKNRIGHILEPLTTDLNDGKIKLGVTLPNLNGSGEKLEASGSVSWNKDSEQMLTFYKPNLTSAFLGPRTILFRLGNRYTRIPWSGLRAREHYASLIVFHDPLPWLQWKTKFRLGFRHLFSRLQPSTSASGSGLLFHEREECGHSMESAFIHTITADTRDDRVLPWSGLLAKATQSVSGYFGDVHAVKHRLQSALYLPLANSLSLGFGFDLGVVSPLANYSGIKNRLNCYDSYCFSGPLQCRGWNNERLRNSRISSNSESQLLIAASFKVISNIPLLRGSKSWFLNNTQAHAFIDFGSIGHLRNLNPSKLASLEWLNWQSLTFGAGLAIRLGKYGRAELNYVIPISSYSNCHIKPGLQLGIGVNIL